MMGRLPVIKKWGSEVFFLAGGKVGLGKLENSGISRKQKLLPTTQTEFIIKP